MSKISADVKNKIAEIKRLSDGTIADQLKACKELFRKKIFSNGKLANGIDSSVLPALLEIIFKFFDSNHSTLQKHGASFINYIICTPDGKENTTLVIDANILPQLIHLLASTNSDVITSTLQTLASIAFYFPEKLIEPGTLSSIIQCLKSKNKQVTYEAARCLSNIAYDHEECITAVLEADCIEPLLQLLEQPSTDDGCLQKVLNIFVCIAFCNSMTCQRVLDAGALERMKNFFDRLFAVDVKSVHKRVKSVSSRSNNKKLCKILAIQFIKDVTSYGEAQIDMVIDKGFVPLVLQQMKDGYFPEVKSEAIRVVENIIAFKRDMITTFINEHGIISLYYSNLQSTNTLLILPVLIAMSNIIALFEDKYICRQKIQDCGNSDWLQKLFDHSSEEIRELAHFINDFVNDIEPTLTASAATNDEYELIELNHEAEDTAETPPSLRQQKRPTNAQEGSLRKRFRISIERTEHSITPVNDGDSARSDDFDDHPVHSATVPPDDESTRNNSIPRNHSLGVVEIDEMKTLIPRQSSASVEFDNTSRPLSHISPNLPEAGATNDEEMVIIETKPSPTPSQPIVIQLPVEITAANTAVTITSDNSLRQAATLSPPSPLLLSLSDQTSFPTSNDALPTENIFSTIKYWRPYEKTIHEYCEELGIQFNRDDYDDFIRKIKLTPIKPNSEPITFYTPIDQSGFGAFSILLTGNEDGAKTIKDKVDRKFINALHPLDSERITKVVDSIITLPEHFETIAAWLKCRIMIYSYGEWERYGDFESDDANIPLFVLAKNSIKGNTVFYIVLSLKNE